jgi:para-nitrobenzyl esterase
VRAATAPGSPCPQGETGAEDCLYLNVTAPTDTRRGERLPVLVWLHGGGFTSGAGAEYDGARLATEGRMVVVTVNYRLGALGFLATPVLGDGNYGLMDQTAALRWVHRNAARFGGDPANVTLAGQSAGARSICAQLAAPAALGLFHRAIIQSGACDNAVPDLAAAHAFAATAMAQLGCTTAACLRERTPADLLRTLPGVGRPVNARSADRPWSPVAGTRVLPRQPRDALRDVRMPLLVGGNSDEMNGFVSNLTVTEDQYRTMMAETFGDQADTVLAEYPVTGTPARTLATVVSDWGGNIGACPVQRTADAARHVYAYEFTEDSRQTVNGLPMGSYHGLELSYLWRVTFPNSYPPLNPAQERLSTTMIAYWSAFIHTGNPNGDDRPHWPRFDDTDSMLTLGSSPARDHRCDFWAGLPR